MTAQDWVDRFGTALVGRRACEVTEVAPDPAALETAERMS